MKEKLFNVGNSTYLQKEKPKKRTSKLLQKIKKHKIITTITLTTSMCLIMNFWLIYRFIKILEEI